MALALDDSSADATYFRAQARSRTGNIWSAEADWHRCLLLARLQENEALTVMTEQVTHRPVSTYLLCLMGSCPMCSPAVEMCRCHCRLLLQL